MLCIPKEVDSNFKILMIKVELWSDFGTNTERNTNNVHVYIVVDVNGDDVINDVDVFSATCVFFLLRFMLHTNVTLVADVMKNAFAVNPY